jgi:hypothetical protein
VKRGVEEAISSSSTGAVVQLRNADRGHHGLRSSGWHPTRRGSDPPPKGTLVKARERKERASEWERLSFKVAYETIVWITSEDVAGKVWQVIALLLASDTC